MYGPIAFDQKHARTIMQRYREFLPKAPEDLMRCYDGAEDKGKAAVAARMARRIARLSNFTIAYRTLRTARDRAESYLRSASSGRTSRAIRRI